MKTKLMKFKDSKVLWYGITTVILVALVYLADIGDFIDALRSVDPFMMFFAFLAGLSVFLVWGYVWHSFFRQLNFHPKITESYKIVMAGNFMNSITPLGQLGGEPFMAYIVSDNTEASYEKSLSAVISADLVNAIPFLTYATLGIGYVVFFTTLTQFMKRGIYAIVFLNIVLMLAAYLVWFKTERVESFIHNFLDSIGERSDGLETLIEPLKERVKSAKESFKKVGEDRRHLAKVGLIAHLGPATQFICLTLILIGLGIEPMFTGIYFTVILSGLAIFSPTPGGTGTFEAAFSALLLFFYPTIGLDTAVAAAILFRLTTYWPGILIGYITLLELRREGEK